MRESGSGTQQTFEQALQNLEITPSQLHVILVLSSGEMVKAIVESGVAVAAISELMVKKELQLGTLRSIQVIDDADYHIAVNDISLVHVHFSERFSDAVEAKQIAEQDAKRADFLALKASKEAQARVNAARGEAEAQMLLRETLTPELLEKQAIEKWNGKLPLIVGEGGAKLLDLSKLVKADQ
jgi:regulator of protease activity HflC (stomatin/prohibitin superfamily)